MSTNKIDDMTEEEAKNLLNDIASVFSIGGKARSSDVILRNVENCHRRSACLSRIEDYHTSFDDEPDGERLLNWGDAPDKYLTRYKEIMDA